ncbi:glutathione S-transferase N-terminal domain-containing protein [Francisella noatunensis]|uniref:Glutathione S-transferase N-terminal domain-containing protein n=1 Tax=Francisella noatunensis TaxID=657445 RepID=A0A9Q2QJH7_9GAMM|nr:glutathione S-transferase N-terminal domain-containing protein [Francisella noatunensis]MBK2028433.1 glutathione S-transferase N-terminal domain-containing protein [Francisella noatunensis]MBK2033852.1 glutathione S-transferase N-terminal domain-containing protein [Francisella noatunensis]MBK2049356.1 glutathione S-transferase N-terminal domain-containing protein [Francisella noatunensis]MBK2050799.1 glutathione S-transferase N-terminal domain-containing protein [Francisella noatunensis]MBK
MLLYTKKDDIYSDIVRIILLIKGANAKIIDVSKEENSKHLEELNIITPNGNIPTLSTDDFAVYRLSVIIEAIEDLYPFPPMFPVFPKQRANARILLEYVNKTFLQNIIKLQDSNLAEEEASEIKVKMQKDIISTYKTIVSEREISAESNPDAQNINVLTLIITFVFYYFIKLKISIPTKDNNIIKEIKELLSEANFIKTIKA